MFNTQIMFNTMCSIKDRVQSFIQDQKGVVAWEYLLVIAGVSVAIIFAVAVGAPSMTSAVLNATCEGINSVLPTSGTQITCSF